MPIIIGRPNGTSSSGGTPGPDQESRLVSIESVNTQQDIKLDSIQAKDSAQDSQLTSLNSKVDAAVATTTSQAERISTLEDSYVDYAPTIQDIQTKNTEQDGAITLANGKNDAQDLRLDDAESLLSSQASRLTTAESTLATKADLVSGKIPLSQLPDLPVGRKVSVADKAERLGLAVHPDLTIAYESDTADAWALDAGEDPSIEANWDKLGNAQATGVQSFNGRTGNVAPITGDYTTAQITTSSDRAFISDADRVRWDNKSTPTSVEAAVSGLRTEVEAGYIKLNTRGAVNGTATLGSDGKVPTAQLPPLGLTTLQQQRINQIESTANLADAKGDSAATNILAVDNRLTQVDNDSKSRDTAQTTRLTALETASANHILTSQRGAANGVAPLNSTSRVPSANLPTYLPQSARVWRDVKSTRVVATWYTNNSGNEMDVHVRMGIATTANKFISLLVRQNSSSTSFVFNSAVLPAISSGTTFAEGNTITVPAGWQYQLATTGGTTDSTVERWYELS